MSRFQTVTCAVAGFAAALFCFACGGAETITGKHPVLGDLEEAFVDSGGVLASGAPDSLAKRIGKFAAAADGSKPKADVTIDYPLDESVFPPEFVPPTFLWHDEAASADTWLVTIAFSDGESKPIRVLLPGSPRPEDQLDMEAFAPTNEPYVRPEYDQSARAWTPTRPLWEEIKRRSVEAAATATFTGFSSARPDAPVSRGRVRIITSKDPVGAPFFYRDVPLMPQVGEHGRIAPLGAEFMPLIAWRLRDVSRTDSKLVLKGMASCGNCHSFSLDGTTLGMDVDGPEGDKGMYAIKRVEKNMVIGPDDVITWNSFKDKPEGHRTIGFMSRVSPDGRYVASTVNEALFVTNFTNYQFLQVFYPTRGILAVYSKDDDTIRALPGADDTEYVHCSPSWSPDGQTIVFSRAKAFAPFVHGQKMPMEPNDPNEPPIRYDLVRIPFNGGKGGTPVPVEGASNNGMSNTFPKISPDGKWIVFTKCRNGLLIRPDSRLWIVPFEGGEAREMRCNTKLMNSWHSFSPNGRWLVFSSKSRTPYTQAFLTHIDENGNDSPAILVPHCTADNRAVNIPEFLNAPYDALDTIRAPVVAHYAYATEAERLLHEGDTEGAIESLEQALQVDPTFVRALVNLGAVLLRAGLPEKALGYLEQAEQASPGDLYTLNNLVVAYLDTGRPYQALRYLNRLEDLAPAFPNIDKQRVRANRVKRNFENELAEVEKEVTTDPGDVEALRHLADVYRRAGRLEDSIHCLEKASELSPEDPRPISRLAWFLATNPDGDIRNGPRAVELAKRAVEMTGGKRPEPLDILSAAYAEVGQFDLAVQTAERARDTAKVVAPDQVAGLETRIETLKRGEPIRTSADR